MRHVLPRAVFSCVLVLVIAASSVSAQDHESRSIYQFGGFKLGVIKTQDEAVKAENACEISIALNCDGQMPFISCLPQLVNLFGNSVEEEQQVIVAASGCDNQCCQGQVAEAAICGTAECTGCCAAPALTAQVNCPAETSGSCCSEASGSCCSEASGSCCSEASGSCCSEASGSCCSETSGSCCSEASGSCCSEASGSCSTVSGGSCCPASQTQPGFQVSQLLTNQISSGCKACPHQAASNESGCTAHADHDCEHNEMVRLVSHVEAVAAANGPTQHQLMNGLMEARVENARLQMQIEAMKHHCGMIEEMAELRARNELLQEMAELRTQNVELHVRLEMQERQQAMAPHQQMHSSVGPVSMPRAIKARAVRISKPLEMQNVNLTGSPQVIAVPLTPKCTACPNCPNQDSVELKNR